MEGATSDAPQRVRPPARAGSVEADLAVAEDLAVRRDLALQTEFVRELEALQATTAGRLAEREELFVVWAAEIERLRAEVAELSRRLAAGHEALHALTQDRDEFRVALERIRSHPLVRAGVAVRRMAGPVTGGLAWDRRRSLET